MEQARSLIFEIAMQVWHFVRRLIKLAITAFVSIVVGFTLYAVLSFPDLKPWHTERLDEEFSGEAPLGQQPTHENRPRQARCCGRSRH